MFLTTDADDCLLDWGGGFRQHVISKGIPTKGDWVSSWDLGTWMSPELVRPTVNEFNASAKFGELKPIPGAIKAMTELAKHHPIVVITSCSDDLTIVAMRERNLKDLYGDIFYAIHCLPIGVCKGEILAKYATGGHLSFWIEDKYENALKGHEVGHRAILFTRPHNQGMDHPFIRRCETWSGIKDYIDTRREYETFLRDVPLTSIPAKTI